MGVAHLLVFIFPLAMAYAAASDLLTMRISNAVTLGIAAAFVPVVVVAGMPVDQVLMHLGTGAIVLVAGMVLFSLRLLGGGDAKLLAAGSLWIGFTHLIPFLAIVTVFGGALALLILGYRRAPATAMPMLPGWAVRLHQTGTGIPYGIAIAAGALTIYPMTSWPMLLS